MPKPPPPPGPPPPRPVVPPTRLPEVDPRLLPPEEPEEAGGEELRLPLLRLPRLFDLSPKRLVLPRRAPRLEVVPPEAEDIALDVMLNEPPLELVELLLPPLEELPPELPPDDDRELPPPDEEDEDEPPPPPPRRLRPPENVPPSLRPLSWGASSDAERSAAMVPLARIVRSRSPRAMVTTGTEMLPPPPDPRCDPRSVNT